MAWLDAAFLYIKHDEALRNAYLAVIIATMVLPAVWLAVAYEVRRKREAAALSALKAAGEVEANSDPKTVADRNAVRFALRIAAVWFVAVMIVMGLPLWGAARYYEQHPEERGH